MTTPRRVKVTGDLFHGQVPDGAIYAARGKPGLPASPYANPYPVSVHGPYGSLRLYWQHMAADPGLMAAARRDLAGSDLACWCPPGQPCHVDGLLAVANRSGPPSAPCPYCWSSPGRRCVSSGGWPRGAHTARVKLAQLVTAVQAHADPALDGWFVATGPCGLCGVKGLGARHRVVDAIAGRLAAGEDPGEVAEDYGVRPEAVGAVRNWMGRWEGAWR